MVERQRGRFGSRLQARRIALLWSLVALLANDLSGAPVITKVSPESGSPGTSVTLDGSDLSGTMDVRFGNALSIFSVASYSRVVATVPLDATTGPITLTSSSGTCTNAKPFLVAPRIDRFQPMSASQGASVTVTGLNFDGAQSVQFGGSNASFQVTAPTQLQATVPAGANSGPISITTSAGMAMSPANFIVTTNQPFISSFSPLSGGPSTAVTINGINLNGATAVRFSDRVPASFSVTAPTQIRATVPASASTGPITVVTPSGTNTSGAVFTVTTAPTIISFQPLGGAPGTDVVVNGRGFLGATAVRFNGTNAAYFSVVADTQLHATVQAGASTGPISIVTAKGTGISLMSFTCGTGPIVIDFNPSLGLPGSYVAINGANFTAVQSVKFGSTPAQFSITAPTQILAVVPNGAANGPITVTSPAGTTQSKDPFTVRTGKPIITDFYPTAGVPGTAVRITGTDFSGASSVQFNGVGTSFTIAADTLITAVVPAAALTGPISVQTQSGTGTSSSYFIGAPRIASFSPASGVVGTNVAISGSNFTDVISVRFGAISAAFTNRSANEITAVVPSDAMTASISVTTPAGIVATPSAFLVLPWLESFEPANGPSGTRVTLRGTGFSGATGVSFGGTASTDFTVSSKEQIVAIVPAQALTGPITVSTPSGSSTSLEPFIVGPMADLTLAVSQSTNTVLYNGVVTYTLAVTNRGPSAASSVVLSHTLAPDLLLWSATANGGSFNRVGQELRLEVPSLAKDREAQLTVSFLALCTGSVTNLSKVNANELDPELEDNSTVQIFTIVASSAVLRIEVPTPDQVRLSWPLTANGFLLEASSFLDSAARWERVNAAPVTIGDENVVLTPLTPQETFYRLRKP
jgi:uncharacterized repeat protein (TIGR01451 family)